MGVATIMDKSPWDSNAVFIFFCHFWVSSWNSVSLACEQALGFEKGWKNHFHSPQFHPRPKARSQAMYPFWNCVAVLPPHLIQSWNLKKILDIRIQLCLWVEGRVWELCELENTPEMQKCPKAFIHDFRIVCLVFQIPDCPTIPILLGSSQFCLKIPNPDQYSIGTGKILIVTSVVINKPEQLPQTVLNWNWYPENLNILPEI